MKLIEKTLQSIVPQDAKMRAKARARLEQLTMPYWALGRLMDLAEDLAGMTHRFPPPVKNKVVVTMAADHGVVAEGVSKYPQEVTVQMIHNFINGGAGINSLARLAGARVVVVDMGVAGDLGGLVRSSRIVSKHIGDGTKNIARGPAMSREDAVRCVEAGIEVAHDLASSADLIGTGEMGIGNTTASSAIVTTFTGRDADEVTGHGTGIGKLQLQHKVDIVRKAIEVNHPNPKDGLDVLAKIGGFEIGGLAGLILGAAALKKPILVDGFISTAAALIAQSLAPESCAYMIASHRSAEQGHRIALMHLKKHPLIDLEMRLGEGTGAALAMHLVEAAARILTEVATFEEASISSVTE